MGVGTRRSPRRQAMRSSQAPPGRSQRPPQAMALPYPFVTRMGTWPRARRCARAAVFLQPSWAMAQCPSGITAGRVHARSSSDTQRCRRPRGGRNPSTRRDRRRRADSVVSPRVLHSEMSGRRRVSQLLDRTFEATSNMPTQSAMFENPDSLMHTRRRAVAKSIGGASRRVCFSSPSFWKVGRPVCSSKANGSCGVTSMCMATVSAFVVSPNARPRSAQNANIPTPTSTTKHRTVAHRIVTPFAGWSSFDSSGRVVNRQGLVRCEYG